MNTNDNWTVVDRKMLELRILTNANWKRKEYELAVMGEKMLRGLEAARAHCENAALMLQKLPKSVSELRDGNRLQAILEAQTMQSLKS
jgi:hypothetical protein